MFQLLRVRTKLCHFLCVIVCWVFCLFHFLSNSYIFVIFSILVLESLIKCFREHVCRSQYTTTASCNAVSKWLKFFSWFCIFDFVRAIGGCWLLYVDMNICISVILCPRIGIHSLLQVFNSILALYPVCLKYCISLSDVLLNIAVEPVCWATSTKIWLSSLDSISIFHTTVTMLCNY